MHFPGYKYLGPGTHIIEKFNNKVMPINELDAYAMSHDLDYLNSVTKEDRDLADDIAINRMQNHKGLSLLALASAQMLKVNKFLRNYDLDFGK